jgi:cation transport regulator ChaC
MSVLWYFAYGSNMCASTFVERRGIHPLEARRARLDAHRLCFNLPVGPGERAVANVEPDADACTWGVAYLISAEQAEHLDRTEGVHRGAYARSAVTIELESAERLAAFTYRSALTCEGRKPSARYLQLLLAGAREHGLPAEYVRALEALELAWDERLGAPRRDGA